jgi:hypothetical protein
MKKILILSLFLSSLFAQIATLIQKEGIVKVKHKNSIKKSSLKINDKIENGDIVYTYNSIAVIKLENGSIIKLTPHSTLKMDKNKVSQKTGKIYFHIKKQKVHKLAVATTFTTIGVKGTTFIVNSTQNKSVSLKKGLLQFKSLNGKYEIHKKKLVDEFNNYIKKQESEFNSYKKQLYKEFIEYKSEFSLKENKTVSFNGNKVYENDMNKNNVKEFDKFEKAFKLSTFNLKNYEKNETIKLNTKETNISKKELIKDKGISQKIIKEIPKPKKDDDEELEKNLHKNIKNSNKNDFFNELDEE